MGILDDIINETSYLGTTYSVLLFFVLSGAVVSGLIALFFIIRVGLSSLSFKLIGHALLLTIPISWMGLSVGNNLNNDIDNLTEQTNLINIGLTAVLTMFFAIIILASLNRTLQNHIKILNQAALTVAQGDLRRPKSFITAAENDIFSPFYISFLRMLEELQGQMKEIVTASSRVAGTAEEIAASSSEVSSSSNSISTIMEKISQGTSSQVERILDAGEAEKELENTINEGFDEIFDSLELVQEISEETNLLALNAAIEAQRAGDAGRGFTIVAQNVRRLSDDSRSYADEILNVLNGIEAKIKQNYQKISGSISKVREVSEEVAASSEEVSSSAQEQSATLEEMSAATQELANLANRLEETVLQFKTEE
ncbi:MAG: methyl-accepting chemotaxis protein [Candidatus Kariarchaeaceae archaeon]|jgi:methyl-accepting chemotaxis protein